MLYVRNSKDYETGTAYEKTCRSVLSKSLYLMNSLIPKSAEPQTKIETSDVKGRQSKVFLWLTTVKQEIKIISSRTLYPRAFNVRQLTEIGVRQTPLLRHHLTYIYPWA
jgi:hypothetical protein